ncbi:amidase domain-containing protein [Lentzea tibetensis]|uniref:amidase domain-containing protein n=1 Tax=Lentzea tibetensis TaxID=2591470 RepID=UPI0016446FBF|nr:amidase domain-containing protein [Lentzea tibetensis]
MSNELKGDTARLDERRKKLQDIDCGFSHAEVATTVEKLDVAANGRRATVRVLESTKLYFQVTDASSPKFEWFALPHTLELVRGSSGWQLAEVKAELTTGAPAPSTQFTSSVPTTGQAGPGKTRSDVAKPADGQRAQKVITAAYDYYAMAEYAKRYVYSSNPAYRTYDQDCTNFISQAMRAGGWEPVDGDRTSNGAWYYGNWTWTTSYTWAGAENWYWFATGSGRTWILPYVYDMGFADVLQADWDRDNIVDHTMLVTQVDTVDRYLTYHSGPELNKRLAHLINENPNAWWYSHRT